MEYKYQNKAYNIPDDYIDNTVDLLGISISDAANMWLADNAMIPDPSREMNTKLKKFKVNHGIEVQKKGGNVPKKIASDEKIQLFNELQTFLNEFCEKNDANVSILTKNKAFLVKIGEKSFKIDLIQHRK